MSRSSEYARGKTRVMKGLLESGFAAKKVAVISR
jgi:hypothetical protein